MAIAARAPFSPFLLITQQMEEEEGGWKWRRAVTIFLRCKQSRERATDTDKQLNTGSCPSAPSLRTSALYRGNTSLAGWAAAMLGVCHCIRSLVQQK